MRRFIIAVVLVVEDNAANLKLVALILRHLGHTMLPARDAEEAIIAARAAHPDLILMDIQLPGMDGLEATSLLKKDPVTAAIPILAVTALAMKGDREKSLGAGCDGYLLKPLRYHELCAALSTALTRQTI